MKVIISIFLILIQDKQTSSILMVTNIKILFFFRSYFKTQYVLEGPEVMIKLSKKKFKFFEVPISYNGRSYEEGKKIGLIDAFVAIFCIIKYKFID